MTVEPAGPLKLVPVAAAASRARRFVRRELALAGATQEVTDTAELLVTELVTNVVLHARTSAVVVVSSEESGAFRISVSDGSVAPPHLRSYGVGQSTGRGLRLVAVMSREWGVGPSAAVGDAGKEVWFVVPADLVDVDALAALYGGFDLDEVKGAAS